MYLSGISYSGPSLTASLSLSLSCLSVFPLPCRFYTCLFSPSVICLFVSLSSVLSNWHLFSLLLVFSLDVFDVYLSYILCRFNGPAVGVWVRLSCTALPDGAHNPGLWDSQIWCVSTLSCRGCCYLLLTPLANSNLISFSYS